MELFDACFKIRRSKKGAIIWRSRQTMIDTKIIKSIKYILIDILWEKKKKKKEKITVHAMKAWTALYYGYRKHEFIIFYQ